MERRSLDWFERRRKTKGLDVAHDQIVKAVETVVLLHQAAKSYAEGNRKEALQHVSSLFVTEAQVDKLRSEVFIELSKGSVLISDYREDLLHLVKRLDTVADDAKDAARCLEMLAEAKIPDEMLKQTVIMTAQLVESAETLRKSVDKIVADPNGAISGAHQVEKIEHEIDKTYLCTKAMFVKHGTQVNMGALVIFDDMIEFIEQAAYLCADTADYIVILASRE